MGQVVKKIIFVFLLAISWNIPSFAGGKWEMPDDVPTLELLIQVHKDMVKAEKLATKELGVIAVEHKGTKELATKYNETRNLLNEKLADVGSYITLASRISSLALQVKGVYDVYENFMKTTYENAKKYPFTLGICYAANKEILSEIDKLIGQSATMVSQQTNLLKATMEEKHKYLNTISARLSNIKMIVRNAERTVRSYLGVRMEMLNMAKIAKSGAYERALDDVKSRWNNNIQ